MPGFIGLLTILLTFPKVAFAGFTSYPAIDKSIFNIHYNYTINTL